MDLKGVLLDIDGTLLFSNEAHAQAFAEAATELGMASDLPRIRQLIGKGGDKLIPEAFGFDAESPQGKQLGERKKKIFKERYLPTLQPTPGARALVSRFLQEKLKVVASCTGKARQLKSPVSGLMEAPAGIGYGLPPVATTDSKASFHESRMPMSKQALSIRMSPPMIRVS